jgi:VWFA-related protein
MFSFRAISAFFLSLALLSLAVLTGSAQQGANRPANQDPQAKAPQGQAPQGQDPQGQPPQGQAPQGQAPPDQAGQGQPQTPVFRGGINFVRVDVIVDDRKSQPVTDLSQADFEVLEDGKPVPVEQFSLVKVDGNPRPGAPPPSEIRTRNDEELIANRDDIRVFVFFLDDYHVRRANSMTVRDPLTRFVQNQLRPNDIVALMYPLTPVTDLSFTRNHNLVLGAINNFVGRKFDYTPVNQFEQNYARYSTDQVEKIRNDIVMGALQGLAVRLGSLREGRKSVIYVSEGFTAMLPPQMRRQDASAPADPIQSAIAAGAQDSSQQITAEWFGQTDVYSRMREVIDSANRNNTSFYSLDPRGLAPFEYGFDDLPSGPPPSFATDSRALRMTQDTLRSLSEETDGKAIVNRNTLEQGLTQVVRDSSYYYLLGYNSSAPNDGKFHQITVRVKRRDVNVRARRGFWAVTPTDAVRASTPTPEVAKPVQTALASIATSVQAGKYVRTWLGTERGEGGNTRVTLVWEPLTFPPGDRREPAGRVSLLAATAAGNVVFRGRAPDRPIVPAPTTGSLGAGGTSVAATAPAQRLTFDAPPGKVELRITVEGATGGTLDSEIRDIEVPDFTTPQVTLSTPRLYRARTLPELRTITADANAIPAAGREFSRTERVLIRFSAYAPGTERPEATAVLLNRGGTKMSDVPVTVSAIAGTTHEIALTLATVPAGEYLVEVTAKSAAGESKTLIPFRVTS